MRRGSGRPRRDIAAASLFAAAAALPTLCFLIYFAGHGVEPWLFLAPFFGAVQRLSGDGLTLGEGLEHLLLMSGSILPLMVTSAVVLVAERGRVAGLCRYREAVWFVYGWLATALAAVIAMRAMYPGYLLPLVPPLILLSALTLRSADDQLRAAAAGTASRLGSALRRAIAPGMAIVLGLYPYGWVRWSNGEGVWETRLPIEAVARLRQHGLTSSSSLYVPNGDPAIYLLAGIQPPTRYAFPQHLICDFLIAQDIQIEEIRRVLATGPDFIALARTQKMLCQRDDRLAPIDAALTAHYRMLEVVEADGQAITLYRRRTE